MDVAVRAGVATLSDAPHPRRCPLRCRTRHARAAPAALPSVPRPPHVRATPSNIERKRNS